jgi:hypothetical protein
MITVVLDLNPFNQVGDSKFWLSPDMKGHFLSVMTNIDIQNEVRHGGGGGREAPDKQSQTCCAQSA